MRKAERKGSATLDGSGDSREDASQGTKEAQREQSALVRVLGTEVWN